MCQSGYYLLGWKLGTSLARGLVAGSAGTRLTSSLSFYFAGNLFLFASVLLSVRSHSTLGNIMSLLTILLDLTGVQRSLGQASDNRVRQNGVIILSHCILSLR